MDTIEAPQDEVLSSNWEAALSRVDGIVARKYPDATAEELISLADSAKTNVRTLAEADQLKFVLTSLDDGRQSRTIEPEWAETPGFGLPIADYAEAMGLAEPGEFDRFDPSAEWFIPKLANSAGKSVSALIDGLYIPPVMPSEAPQV